MQLQRTGNVQQFLKMCRDISIEFEKYYISRSNFQLYEPL